MNAAARVLAAIAAALAAAFVAGCASSAPVATLLSLSQLSDDDIVNLDPKAIRAAIDVPDRVAIDAARIRVGVRISSTEDLAAEAGAGEWPVEQIASGVYIPLVLRQAVPGRRLYLFRLTSEGQAGLAAVIAAHKTHPNAVKKIALSFALGNAGWAPAGMAQYTYSAWVQLREADGPLLLFEDRVVAAGAPQPAGKS
ncbi:MAG: hypothetical protein NVS9B10_29590 [Nevskia sp.]